MSATRFPCRVPCPECGRSISAEAAPMMGTDHWQHLAKEHGMNRAIAVRYVRSDRRGQDDADPWRIARKPPSDRSQRKSVSRGRHGASTIELAYP